MIKINTLIWNSGENTFKEYDSETWINVKYISSITLLSRDTVAKLVCKDCIYYVSHIDAYNIIREL